MIISIIYYRREGIITMMTQKRYAEILRILDEKGAASVQELAQLLGTSESTIRRSLTVLHKNGKLYKVYGGATAIESAYSTYESDMKTKIDLFSQKKISIARHAAGLINRQDYVYIDAGTTTLYMIDFLDEPNATYVTNGLPHATKLAEKGYNVFILGGQIRNSTEAITGIEAGACLSHYNFTKSFFGTNGVDINIGYSTPNANEGLLKQAAMQRSKHAYILADHSKFNRVCPISFGNIGSATIITDMLLDRKFKDFTTIIETEEKGTQDDSNSNI